MRRQGALIPILGMHVAVSYSRLWGFNRPSNTLRMWNGMSGFIAQQHLQQHVPRVLLDLSRYKG